MTALSWRADENGVALHMPDPTGLTNGVDARIPANELARMYLAQRAAQLGADTQGDL